MRNRPTTMIGASVIASCIIYFPAFWLVPLVANPTIDFSDWLWSIAGLHLVFFAVAACVGGVIYWGFNETSG